MLPTNRPFVPDYGVRPGMTLAEILEVRGLSQADLAERTGRPKKTINEIIQGKAAITSETALQLEKVLGIPAAFWNSLERNYRDAIAREDEREALKQKVGWLKNIPVRDLIRRGWIRSHSDKVDLLREVLAFFGVASTDSWEEVWTGIKKAAAFRQSNKLQPDFGAVAAWLRKGEIDGREAKCAPFEASKFRNALAEIRELLNEDPNDFCPKMKSLCADAGVALTFVPELPKLRVWGVARWLSPDKALIQLSLYRKREDLFWFAFFHESGHVLLHGKRDVFLDSNERGVAAEELEADQFALDSFMPTDTYGGFVAEEDFSADAIRSFAAGLRLPPGIVVGRLQHDGLIAYAERNDLVRYFRWDEADEN